MATRPPDDRRPVRDDPADVPPPGPYVGRGEPLHAAITRCLHAQSALTAPTVAAELVLASRLAGALDHDTQLTRTGRVAPTAADRITAALVDAGLPADRASRALLTAVTHRPALRDTIARTWLSAHADDGRIVVADRTAVPLGAHDPRTGDGGAYPPEFVLPATPHEGGHMRLVSTRGHAVTLHLLDTATPAVRVATVHPCPSAEDIHVPPVTTDTPPRFHGVRPTAPDDVHLRRVDELLEAAAEHRPRVAVVPELNMSPATQDALCGRPLGPLDVLVAGTVHTGDRNAAKVRVRGLGTPVEVDKVEPFTYRSAVEHLADDRARRVDVLCWDTLRVAVLICRDALAADTVDVLADLGVRLLLVPAMTDDLSAFHRTAAHLAGLRQASTVVANSSPDGQADIALIASAAGPTRPHVHVGPSLQPAVVSWAAGRRPVVRTRPR